MAEPRPAIGVIGLGAMGGPIARRLLDAHGPLYVHDVDADAMAALAAHGATACASPAEVAGHAETVFLSLPDAGVVLAVVAGDRGVFAGDRVRTVVDLSTTGPEGARRLRELADRAGVSCLDAPVSGGPAGAAEGRLTVMAAGSADCFHAVEPLLRSFGRTVLHVSDEPGHGQLTKVLNNVMSAAAIAITAEALAVGVKNGLDPARLLDAVNASSGRNTASADKFPRCVLPRTFDYGFRLSLMAKDVALCLQAAEHSDAPMLLGSAVHQLWEIAESSLPAGSDCTAIAQVVERWAGVTIGDG
jgi:3-hydroxyisobutyrate dehydrogenase-like beta-hydroxyacid dehydrogenase